MLEGFCRSIDALKNQDVYEPETPFADTVQLVAEEQRFKTALKDAKPLPVVECRHNPQHLCWENRSQIWERINQLRAIVEENEGAIASERRRRRGWEQNLNARVTTLVQDNKDYRDAVEKNTRLVWKTLGTKREAIEDIIRPVRRRP